MSKDNDKMTPSIKGIYKNGSIRLIEPLPKNLKSQKEILVTLVDEDDLDLPSMEELVQQIRALPKNKSLVSLPKASLADALRSAPADPDFNLDEWEIEWAKAEKELEQLNLNDN